MAISLPFVCRPGIEPLLTLPVFLSFVLVDSILRRFVAGKALLVAGPLTSFRAFLRSFLIGHF
jgi:hypothetical protein